MQIMEPAEPPPPPPDDPPDGQEEDENNNNDPNNNSNNSNNNNNNYHSWNPPPPPPPPVAAEEEERNPNRSGSVTTTPTTTTSYPTIPIPRNNTPNRNGCEVFMWGGPERREGENEPVYAEGLAGIGVLQIAFTTPSLDATTSHTSTTTTTSSTSIRASAIDQSQQQPRPPLNPDNGGVGRGSPSLVLPSVVAANSGTTTIDPRNRAVAFVLTKDYQLQEWGPFPNWSSVEHKSRRIQALSCSSSTSVVGPLAQGHQVHRTSSSCTSSTSRTARHPNHHHNHRSNATAPTPH